LGGGFAEDERFSGRRMHKPKQDFDRGRFPAAIWPKEAADPAFRNGEVKTTNANRTPIPLGKPVGLDDHQRTFSSSRSSWASTKRRISASENRWRRSLSTNSLARVAGAGGRPGRPRPPPPPARHAPPPALGAPTTPPA